MHEPIWVYPPEDRPLVEAIATEFNIHPCIAQILVTRNYKSFPEIHDFLYAQLPNLLDPELLLDMDVAVERIEQGLKRQETLLIFGDTDVDGMTSAALLTEFFRLIGFEKVHYHLPNRTTIKKSLLAGALDEAKRRNATLLITVDCGITAASEVEELVSAGIDVIITDHHAPTSRIPHCIATLNPKLINSEYPNRDLPGVGVAFKLAHAVANSLIEKELLAPSRIDLKQFLDLVALGTISDMCPLRGENRILVRYGLKELRLSRRVGLAKLIAHSNLKPKELTPTLIASKIAPKLNSLGRIADPSKGVELLLVTDQTEAERLANELDLHNLERQKIERVASGDIETYISENPLLLEEKAIFLASEKWHPGIVPILASRISKTYNRPALLLSLEDGVAKGSLRTIPEFPLLPLLKDLEGLLLSYGGHDFAAGLTVRVEHLPALKKRFLEAAQQKLCDTDVTPKLFLDAPLSLCELTFDLLESLQLLEPYGSENPPPLLYASALQVWPPKITGGHHLKFFLMENDRMLEGIGFHLADRAGELQEKDLILEIAFTPFVNTFRKKTSIQLGIKDFTLQLEQRKATPNRRFPKHN